MKIYLKFDHSKESFYESLCPEKTEGQAMQDVLRVLREYIANDKVEKKSHLAELIHEKLDYENILYLATEHIAKGISETSATMMAIDKLRKMLEDDED
jgi:hypothetical protein